MRNSCLHYMYSTRPGGKKSAESAKKICERFQYLYPINSDITDEQACLIEPMGVAHNIIERIDVKGKSCLVIGCGPVGLFAISCAKGEETCHVNAPVRT